MSAVSLAIGALAGLVVGLALLALSQWRTLKLKDTKLRTLQEDLKAERALANAAQDRMIDQLILMRREGFQTVPDDEPFETFRLTPEQEADIEEARNAAYSSPEVT
jgi:hypothetical protein